MLVHRGGVDRDHCIGTKLIADLERAQATFAESDDVQLRPFRAMTDENLFQLIDHIDPRSFAVRQLRCDQNERGAQRMIWRCICEALRDALFEKVLRANLLSVFFVEETLSYPVQEE